MPQPQSIWDAEWKPVESQRPPDVPTADDDEQSFQKWYGQWANITGISPHADEPEHHYDYRAAYKAGAIPAYESSTQEWHWPSQFKAPDHPRRFVGGIDTTTGLPVKEREEGIWKADWQPLERETEKPEFSFKRLGSQAARSAAQGFADIARFMRAAEISRDIEEEEQVLKGRRMPGPRERFHMREWFEKQASKPTPEQIKAERIRFRKIQQTERTERFGRIAEAIPKPLEGSSGILEDAVTGMARFLPAMGISAMNPVAGAGMTFAQLTGAKFDELTKQGVDKESAYTAAVFSGLAQTPVEMAGNLLQIGALKNLAKTFNVKGAVTGKLTKLFEALSKGTLGEGVEEYIQQYPDEFANIMAANPDMSVKELGQEFKKQLPEIQEHATQAAKVGAVGGALLPGIGGIIQTPFTVGAYISDKQKAIPKETASEGIKRDYQKGILSSQDLEELKEKVDPPIAKAIDKMLEINRASIEPIDFLEVEELGLKTKAGRELQKARDRETGAIPVAYGLRRKSAEEAASVLEQHISDAERFNKSPAAQEALRQKYQKEEIEVERFLPTESKKLAEGVPPREYVQDYAGETVKEAEREGGESAQLEKPIDVTVDDIWNQTPRQSIAAWEKAMAHVDQVKESVTTEIQKIEEQIDKIKGKRDKKSAQIKKEARGRINELKSRYETLVPFYEEQVKNQERQLYEQAENRALQWGVIEEVIEDFMTEFQFAISGERPYSKVNADKTAEQIFEETIIEYLPESRKLLFSEEPTTESAEVSSFIDEAAREAETEPTPAQIKLHGLDISIENPKGSTRKGVDKQGKPWESILKHHYGSLKRTEDKDGEQVDVFIGPNPESEKVFIVNQVDPETKRFDEHKALIGFESEKKARVGYLANYQRGWKGLSSIVEMDMDSFKDWLKEADLTKPANIPKEPHITIEHLRKKPSLADYVIKRPAIHREEVIVEARRIKKEKPAVEEMTKPAVTLFRPDIESEDLSKAEQIDTRHKDWADEYIRNALKQKDSNRAKEIRLHQKYFEGGGYARDLHATAKSLLQYFGKGAKKGWIKERPDTSSLERLMASPEFYFEKVPAAWRVFNAALERIDDYYGYYSKMTGDDALMVTIKQLEKERPKEYQKLTELIREADMNKKTYEAKDLRKKGFSDQAINAWLAYRKIMNNAFDILYAEMAQMIKEHEAAGLPIPSIVTYVADRKLVVNLKIALAQMGQMRGWYAPRIRRSGNVMLTAKKKGANPVLEFYDLALRNVPDEKGKIKRWKSYFNAMTPMGRRARELESQGYNVTLQKSKKMPEDIFEVANRTISVQAMINSALEHGLPEQRPTLEMFGLRAAMRGIAPGGHKDYIVRGPSSKKMNEVFKSLGGRYYSSAPGEAKAWHFPDPPHDIEWRIVRGLSASLGIPGADETELLFAHALATEVANIVKGRGFRSSMIRRGPGVAEDVWIGYETDPLKAASQYVTNIAAGMAKKNMAARMVKAVTGTDIAPSEFESYEDYLDAVKERRIDPEKQHNIYHDVKTYMDENLRNQEFADRVIGIIKGITVLKYLGFRLASGAVNLTALLTSVPATMHSLANVPLVKVPYYLGKAMTQYGIWRWGDKKSLDPDTVAMFDKIHEKRWHNAQFNMEALAVLRSKLGGPYEKMMNLSMFIFGATEQLNRISTIAGTYMALRDQKVNPEKALATAKKTSDRSHGIYGRITYPHFAQGQNPFAQMVKMLYIFHKFEHTYLQNMYDLGFKKGDRIALIYMALSPAILSGAAAIPFIGTPFISAVGQLIAGLGDDRPEEGEEALYAWVEENMGTLMGDFARFGAVGALAGVSLKGSLRIDPGDTIPQNITELFGAPGNVMSDIYYGGKSILKGDIYRGLEKMGPRFTGSILQGIREEAYGVTTQRNVPKTLDGKQIEPTTQDTIARLLNFNPAHLAKQKEKKWAQTKQIRKYQDMRSDIYTRLRAFYQKPPVNRSEAEYADILADIHEYNAIVRDRGLNRIQGVSFITKESIKRAMRLTR